jgi:UDP-N-acetylmuramate--alanine ligase
MKLHILGIAGTFMGGVAALARELGHVVEGSDQAVYPPMSTQLETLGIVLRQGYSPDNISSDCDEIIVGNALSRGNVAVEQVLDDGRKYTSGAQWLSENVLPGRDTIAVAGTHGKTTTTSLVAAVLEGAGYDPTVINGGIINAYGTNTRLGAGDWMVAEADESDGTFLKLPATIAIVTNIDPEHLDHFGTFEGVKAAFDSFVQNIPFYGFAALCIDHPEVQAMIPRVADRRIITYGFSPQADIRAMNVETSPDGSIFDIEVNGRGGDSRIISQIHLSMLGRHNVLNACAAIAVANEMQIEDEAIRGALARFQGVKRRFTKTGVAGGVTVIDDYGHHPVEISAVLKAARLAVASRPGAKVIAVVQPHRYSRLASLFEDFCTCFNDADIVIVADVYAAGEAPLPGIDRDALVAGLQGHGHRHVAALPDPGALAGMVAGMASSGDFVVCLGAGSITNWAASLPGELTALQTGAAR